VHKQHLYTILFNNSDNKAIVDTSPTLYILPSPLTRSIMHFQCSRKPLPGVRRCGLSSTCWKRTEPRTWATCTKIAKDRECGSGDILADRQTY